MSVNKMVVSSSSSRFPSNTSRLGPTDSRNEIPSDESDTESTVSSKRRIRVRTNSRMRDNPTTNVWSTIRSVNPQPISSRSLSVNTNLTNFTNTTGMEDYGSRLGNDSFLQPPPVKMAKNLEHGREVQMYSQRTHIAAANVTDQSSNVNEYQRRYNINRPAERSNFTNRIAQTTTTMLPPSENVAEYQQNSNNNIVILKIDSKFVNHNWTFFSMWRPSWESILKSANEKQKFPMRMNEFCQEVMVAINCVATSPIKRQLIRVFTVNIVEQEEVRGGICQFLDVVETTQFKKPFGLPPKVGEKLISLVLKSDIIICFDEDPSMEGSETNRPCLVHVTSRDDVIDYGVNSKMLEYDNVEHISYKYIQDPTAKREKYHVLEFIGHRTCSSGTDDEGTAINRVNLHHQFENMEIDVGSPMLSQDSNNENRTGQCQNSETGIIDLSEGNNLSQTSRSSIEVFENSSDGDDSAEENPPDGGFNLEHFVKNGSFVPGPCRPKLKKGNSNENYKYDSLLELALKLNSSIAAAVDSGQQPSMLVSSYCHTYGVVDHVMQEHRHQNAYFVRISDETMESVLLRIHGPAHDKVKKGPQIKVGHIIRVHRVTAQIEWDSWLNDNGMVLSTGNHRNYVIFEQFGEKRYTLIFDTCAMNPSWEEYDKIRVGELLRFKLNHCHRKSGEETVTDQARSKYNLHNVQLVRCGRYLCSSSIGSGIAAIDVSSPPQTPDSIEPVPMEIVVNRVSASPQEGSPNTDDCFETARNTQQSVVNLDVSALLPSQSQRQPECSNNSGTGMGSNHYQVSTPTESQDQNVILFKDLKKTAQPLNLLCRVLALVADHKKNMFHLIVEDLERTMPSAAFRDESNSLMISHDQPESLRLNITNARKLLEESRETVKELQEDQRTDDLYSIKNVKIKGKHPPFQLEIDGSNCVIKRDNAYLMRFMEGSFTASSKSSNPEALSMQASSSSSNQATGHNSPNNNSWDKNLNERPEWTGRPRGRRKPREHYQPEETFEC